MNTNQKNSHSYSMSFSGPPGEQLHLSVSGQMSLQTLTAQQHELRSHLKELKPSALLIDLGGVDYLDSAGALVLMETERYAAEFSIPHAYENMSKEVSGILSLIDRTAVLAPHPSPHKATETVLEQIGEVSLTVGRDFANLLTFLGGLLEVLFQSFFNPRSIRWKDFIFYVKRAGQDGLPIVALLSFLLGMIIAFMSSLQLKQFGANLYVASLVGFGMVRELGPIMTAIIFAGRSGSAFAAEIGTMMVNEEVDALVTMGFDPIRFLALPKVLAAMVVVPLLTLYADLFGILGGMTVGVLGFDLTVFTYVHQTIKSISIFDVVSSLVKAMVFAILIAGIGCQRGFRVRGGAEAVGKFTTSAVVAGLFLIIVADSLFAIILYYIR
ncbi:MAG: MlaE family lipid ABC transporter permease subunit [Deltaproteobacteria bacterium]|nr:MlaE family lipid ABC transporter permease subunit [Deltaproteobacteria bacterium]TLN01848.1 MAG: MlaE family lipid ABC transporter permease subunit [bacterium]